MFYAVLRDLISEGHVQDATRKTHPQQLQMELNLILKPAADLESQHSHLGRPGGLAQHRGLYHHEPAANSHGSILADNCQTALRLIDQLFGLNEIAGVPL